MQTSKIFIGLPVIMAMLVTAQVQSQTLVSRNISLEAAKAVVSEAVKYAKANNAPGGAIAVVDNGGNLVYLERLDGTFPAAAEVSIKDEFPSFYSDTADKLLPFEEIKKTFKKI